jgi:hypothetical protein
MADNHIRTQVGIIGAGPARGGRKEAPKCRNTQMSLLRSLSLLLDDVAIKIPLLRSLFLSGKGNHEKAEENTLGY